MFMTTQQKWKCIHIVDKNYKYNENANSKVKCKASGQRIKALCAYNVGPWSLASQRAY